MATSNMTLTIADSATESDYVRVEGFERGSIRIPYNSGATTLQVSITEDSTGAPTNWSALNDETNSAVTAVTLSGAALFPINSNVFKFKYFRVSATNAASGDQTLHVHLAGSGE